MKNEQVRETSVVITTPELGVTLIPSSTPGTPAVVGSVQVSSQWRIRWHLGCINIA